MTLLLLFVGCSISIAGGFLLGIGFMKRKKEKRPLWISGLFSWISAVATLGIGIFLVIYGVKLSPNAHSSPDGTMFTAVGGS